MKKVGTLFILAIILIGSFLFFISFSENYSNGERIGVITQFSKTGRLFKTHEGHLNVTQTGMNSSTGFDFSLDRDADNDKVASILDSAANLGWKVKLVYHQVYGWNWLHNRGNTDFFINEVVVLDRHFDNPFRNDLGAQSTTGKVIDTIYIVITPSDPNYLKFFKDKANEVAKEDTTVRVDFTK